MALCTDKSLTYLNDLGYNVVRLPRRGIDPLDVLGRDGRSIERLGRLDQLWTSKKPVPVIGGLQAAAHINGQQTSEISASIGLKLLSGVLKAIGATVPEVGFAYNTARTLQFTFGDVMTRAVVPLEIGEFLSDGDIHSANPVIEHYFYEHETDVFVITEVLESDQITVSAKGDGGGRVSADVPSIQNAVGANISVSAKSGASSDLTYTGKDGVTFGFKALAIRFDGKWRVSGASPSAALAFEPGSSDPGSDPVILGRGALQLR
jgi:hypothetical protein